MGPLGAYGGLLVRIGLYLLVFPPTVGFYVYRDARRRGLGSPLARGIGYGLLGVPGLLVYEGRKRRD